MVHVTVAKTTSLLGSQHRQGELEWSMPQKYKLEKLFFWKMQYGTSLDHSLQTRTQCREKEQF